jgi:uncharacterized membrane protein YqiK
MSAIFSFLSSWLWLVIVLIAAILYKVVLRVFFGTVIVPEDKMGLVTKKFVLFGDKKAMPDGKIIALDGEAGYQAKTLAPGIYFGMWFWQYEVIMQPFTIVEQGKIGLLLAKDGSEQPTGRILARRVPCDNFQDADAFLRNGGQKGRQSAFITAGTYRINTHLFDVRIVEMMSVDDNSVGIITALDGEPLPEGQIAGRAISGHNNYQDFDVFLSNGGCRGLQSQIILAGSYNLNPWAITIECLPMTEIPIGHVGVVISFFGEEGKDTSGEDFRHGNIVQKGHKGVWNEPLGPGKYPLNRYIMKVEIVPTTNLVLNWASARTESHQLDRHLSTITVRSRDGFPFNLDVSQIIHVPASQAPKVIARFGGMVNLVSQVLEPTIGNYFRNSAQNSDVISFLSSRKERQESARSHIRAVLEEYDVNAVDTLIGDIVPPESLMKTLTDRKIAEEQKATFETQQKAQEQRQGMEKEMALADMQRELMTAQQSVIISERTADAAVKKTQGEASSVKVRIEADAIAMKLRAQAEADATRIKAEAEAQAIKLRASAEAERIELTGKAEASKILEIGRSNAEAYRLAVESMGGEAFVRLKITEEIAKGNIKIIPDILISGGNNEGSGVAGLMGLKMMEMMSTAKLEKDKPAS